MSNKACFPNDDYKTDQNKLESFTCFSEARRRNAPVGNYELDLTSIRNAPATDVVHAKIFTRSTMKLLEAIEN